MAIYLGYGVRHSNERRTDDKQVADKDSVITNDADVDKSSQQQAKSWNWKRYSLILCLILQSDQFLSLLHEKFIG